MVRTAVIRTTILLIVGNIIGEIPFFVSIIYPETTEIFYTDIWVDKSYDEKITVISFMSGIKDVLVWVIWFFAVARFVVLFSYQMYYIFLVWVIYFITQLAFFVWNRNSSIYSNLIVYLYMGLSIAMLLFPSKKGGKIINIEYY